MNLKSKIYEKIQSVISSMDGQVLLRNDIRHLGGYRQISRALKKFIREKKLVKIGFGIYAKSYPSKYADEPLIQDGFDTAAREVLDKLHIKWEAGSAEKAYNAGDSQQVPVQNVVQLKTRFRRKLSYLNRQLHFEGNINAR